MNNRDLSKYVEQFKELKEKLLDHKLSESDAAILASRLLELPKSIPTSLFYNLKQREDFKEYKFIGTELIIKNISKINNGKDLKLDFSSKRGGLLSLISLKEEQALLFLSLVIAKYSNFMQDATGGITLEEAEGISKNFCTKLDLKEFVQFDHETPANLARNLLRKNLSGAIDHFTTHGEKKHRLSFPPNRISFNSHALEEQFDNISNSALSRFNEEFSPSFID